MEASSMANFWQTMQREERKLMDLVELWHNDRYQRKIDKAFPVIEALADQRRLDLEQLVKRTRQKESRVRKSLEFLESEGLIGGNWHMSPDHQYDERYLLTRGGHKVFDNRVAA
jgi:transcription initiation factor IIE alpha subunit